MYDNNTDFERLLELKTLCNAVNALTSFSKEDPNTNCWATYTIENGQKIYTDYEPIILLNETGPNIIEGDVFEIVPIDVLLTWYKKRYTQMCAEDYAHDVEKAGY